MIEVADNSDLRLRVCSVMNWILEGSIAIAKEYGDGVATGFCKNHIELVITVEVRKGWNLRAEPDGNVSARASDGVRPFVNREEFHVGETAARTGGENGDGGRSAARDEWRWHDRAHTIRAKKL